MLFVIEAVIEQTRFSKFAELLKSKGEKVYVANPKLTADEIINDAIKRADGDPIFVIGSIELCKAAIAMNERCNIKCFYSKEAFSFFYFVGHLFLNNEYDYLFPFVGEETMSEKKWELYKKYSIDSKVFVRPAYGDKNYSAGLVDLQEFNDFVGNVKKLYSHAPSESVGIVCKPKQIRAEWRVLASLRSRAIITSSLYKWDGNDTFVAGAPKEAISIAESYLADRPNSSLPQLFYIDVCLTEDGIYKIVELNAFSSASMYACDQEKIYKEIKECLDSKKSA